MRLAALTRSKSTGPVRRSGDERRSDARPGGCLTEPGDVTDVGERTEVGIVKRAVVRRVGGSGSSAGGRVVREGGGR